MRLLDFPIGIKFTGRAPLTGPRSARSASTESLTGFVQTTASPFGLWRWQFTFTAMHRDAARRYRGFVVALHGGANAARVPFRDPDGLSLSQAGVTGTVQDYRNGKPWSNGGLWSANSNWQGGLPTVPLFAAVNRYDSTVTLSNSYWGNQLLIGDQIGFGPLYFGLHVVTEVIAPGSYRVWPPLRKTLPVNSYATLEPVMAMRLESENSAPIQRDIAVLAPSSMTLVEIEDADVRVFYQ